MKTKVVSLSLSLLGVLISHFTPLSSPRIAQASGELGVNKQSSARISFVPRGDSPSPRRTQSGASRHTLPGVCDGLPVLPENGLGLTTNSAPSLFVYFAEGTTVEKAQLTLKSLDAEESEYYDTIVTLPKEALSEEGGVVAFEVPTLESGLVLNQEYAWSLILMCDGQLRPDSPILSGSLKRVDDVEVASQIQQAPLVDQAIAYGNAGMWYDLLSTLAAIRLSDASDQAFNEHWSSVMDSVGLDVIASKPLLMMP